MNSSIPQKEAKQPPQNHRFTDKNLQIFVGNILKYGVWSSLFIALFGFILYIFQKDTHPANFHEFVTHFEKKGFDFSEFFNGLLHGDGQSIIYLGIIMLILTPVMRVIFAIIGFHKEGDLLYTIVSIIVLAIIIISTFLGSAT